MATGNRKVDIFLKKFLSQQEITINFFDFLENLIKDNLDRNYPVQGVFKPNTVTTNILSSDTVDTFDIITPFEGTDALGNQLILDPLDANNISFENTNAIPYFVGLRFNRLFRDTEINVRTGKIKYKFLENAIGELAEPDVVVDDGDETLTITLDSVCEVGVSHAGRKAIVFLKDAVSQSLAFEEVTVIFAGGANKIETLTALGQQTGSISTTASDYQVFLKGPTVRRNTDLRSDPNIMFAGIITGAGSGNSPSSFDEADVNDLSQSIGSITTLFFAEHDPADGTHTDITPETITTEVLTTGVQLDTRVAAGDEDSPDVPVIHTLFSSGGGSGIQSVKWQIRDSSGQAIAFIDAHGNAYFQNLAAVTSILQQNLTVTGDTTLNGNMNFGNNIAVDIATFNSKIRSFTDLSFMLDADNDDVGSAFRYFLHDFSTEIFRFEEDGDLAIKAALFNIDLDSANTLTGEAFTVTKNNQGSILFAVNENGDTTASRDSTTQSKTAYTLADGTIVNVDASLSEVYDRTLFRELFQPVANSPNDRLININSASITLDDGSIFTLHNGTILSGYTGGTANFNNGTVTGGGANFTAIDFTGQANQFAKYSVNLKSDDTIVVLPAAGFGATQAAAPDPPFEAGALASFVIAVQDNGSAGIGTILNISEANFIRLPSSSGGAVAGNDTEITFNDGGVEGADSGLTWDNTNKRLKVGIVAEAALADFHILSSGITALLRISTGGTGNTGGFDLAVGTSIDIKGLGSNDMLFFTNNIERIRIAAAGTISFKDGSQGTIGNFWRESGVNGEGEWAALPGSSGGISGEWLGSALEIEEFAEKVFRFTPIGGGSLLTVYVKVPQNYISGSQIQLLLGFYSPSNSNRFEMQLTTFLVRKGTDAINSMANQQVVDTGDIINSLANQFREGIFNLTDGSGEINSVAVSPGDLLKLQLARSSPTGSDDTEDIRFVPSATEVNFG